MGVIFLIFKYKHHLFSFIIFIAFASCSFNKRNSEVYSFQPHGENGIFPQPVGYVNDFEEIFSENQIKELTSLINGHYAETTNQIAIVTIGSIDPYENINEFTIDLANYWRIGHNDQKNGVLIAFSTKLKKVRIQNCIGIEHKLSDHEIVDITENIIIPEFKTSNYFEGVKKGLLAVINKLDVKEEE